MVQLSSTQEMERQKIQGRWPQVYAKQQRFDEQVANGIISPILRLCWSFLCNFACEHCCAEPYMDRALVRLTGQPEPRHQLNLDDVREISRQADDYGIYRFVLTGGEPTTWKDLFAVIEAVDPTRHLVILDSNAWLLSQELIRRLEDVGVYKMQISLDSFVEADHDAFRDKPGSYKRVMAAVDNIRTTGMKLMLSTCLVRGRAFTQEFLDFCEFCNQTGTMLYVTYAKPVGTCRDDHPDWVINKKDADQVRELEKRYNITTHMTPAFMRGIDGALGHYDGCITVKGINTITSTGEIVPCPYMDMSIGNCLKEPLAQILDRGMRNRWLGPHRQDCLIGEDTEFISIHNAAVKGRVLLPVPYGEGFSDNDLIET